MVNIYVFGANGMLGSYVSRYLKEKNFNVIEITRKQVDASKLDVVDFDLYKTLILNNIRENDVLINCVGLIPQRKITDQYHYLKVNALFPHILQQFCDKRGTHLLNITTDCVYDGKKGDYIEEDNTSPIDYYGYTKVLGEPRDASNIRTSIIGEELKNKLSLLEWVKLNKDRTVKGFTNHYWNGITCLQFAKICESVINTDFWWKGVKHIYTPDKVSKFELIKLISDIYDLNVDIIPHETYESCDRSLRSIYNLDIKIPKLKDQIIEQKEFNICKY